MSTRRGAGARDLMTLAEVAALAGVGVQAVSNWRARFPDFPQPALVVAKSPAFRAHEVVRWLRANGRAVGKRAGAGA